ncbi:glycosyltransferase family 2 protein [Candidatus Sumerlaeota bacterium]|nr:glycosyltransferase family 2 protein [Candidatus Sumerlaeota bacterium]
MSLVSVIIPVFNERGTLGQTVRAVRDALQSREHEVVVVNDGSTDAPHAKYEGIGDVTLRHKENRGYGAALLSGFRAARGETLVIIDADGTYPADAIPVLLAALEDGADMAVGRRKAIPGEPGALTPRKILRAGAKCVLRMLANYLSGCKIPDLNSGLRAFRKADAMRFAHLLPSGFSLTTTITLAYLCNGLCIEYVPIEYADRPKDQPAKFRPVGDTWQLLLTILRTILFFNPLKVCLPVALCSWAVSLLALLFSWIFTDQIMDGTVSVFAIFGVQMLILGLLAEVIIKTPPKI